MFKAGITLTSWTFLCELNEWIIKHNFHMFCCVEASVRVSKISLCKAAVEVEWLFLTFTNNLKNKTSQIVSQPAHYFWLDILSTVVLYLWDCFRTRLCLFLMEFGAFCNLTLFHFLVQNLPNYLSFSSKSLPRKIIQYV